MPFLFSIMFKLNIQIKRDNPTSIWHSRVVAWPETKLRSGLYLSKEDLGYIDVGNLKNTWLTDPFLSPNGLNIQVALRLIEGKFDFLV